MKEIVKVSFYDTEKFLIPAVKAVSDNLPRSCKLINVQELRYSLGIRLRIRVFKFLEDASQERCYGDIQVAAVWTFFVQKAIRWKI
jgi:hypothetical protein